MKAVIMAGGEGTRLRPLTCTRPKPMVPVLNRPCMEHIISLLSKHGIRQIAVTLQYLPEEIQDYFGDGSRFGVHLEYFVEKTPLGTAGSVKHAASFLDESFIVISGDALTNCNLDEAAEFHRSKGALATLILTPVPCPLEYGVVITDRDGRIRRFLEKPGWSEVFSDTVNTGIYILEPETLQQVASGQMVDFSKDLYPRLLEQGLPLYAYVMKEYWCDIGCIEAYLQAHYDLLEGRMGSSLPGTEVSPGIFVANGAILDPEARLEPPVVIGREAVVAAGATIGPQTVLGDRVRVEKEASLKRSVVWEQAWIGEGAVLRGAVVGKGTRVKAGATVYEGAVIGDRSVIGEKSLVKAGVKVWPEKWVEGGTRLSTSLVWGSCARARLFGARGISGSLVTDLTPDFTVRLGAAVGTVLGRATRFSLCCDGQACTRMVKQLLEMGLMSTGARVVDLGSLPLPVHRFAIRLLGLQGGVYIHRLAGQRVSLRFFNASGAEFSRNEQRQVEGMLSREEFSYAGADEIIEPGYRPEMQGAYLNYLLEHLDQSGVRGAGIRLVVDYDQALMGDLLPALLESLGCELMKIDDHSYRTSPALREMPVVSEEVSRKVVEQGAHLGALLDRTGEEMVLIDEKGRPVSEDQHLSLLYLITLRGNENPTMVFPVTAPDALQRLVEGRGGRVQRTRTAPWSLMQAFLKDEVLSTQNRYPQYLLYGDALATLGALVCLLAGEGRPFSELLADIPAFTIARREVEVTWEDKGRVLRTMVEGEDERRLEMLEGVKFFHPEGWALVLPDADEPLCRVYSEAFNQEVAESLTEFYVEKIRSICRPGTD